MGAADPWSPRGVDVEDERAPGRHHLRFALESRAASTCNGDARHEDVNASMLGDRWPSARSSRLPRTSSRADLVYSIADDRVKVQRMAKLGVDLADFTLQN